MISIAKIHFNLLKSVVSDTQLITFPNNVFVLYDDMTVIQFIVMGGQA